MQSRSDEYRWVDPRLMHVTLAFLGEQPDDRLPLLERIGSNAAQTCGGTLSLGEAGQFGSKRAPRVLWVDLAGDTNALRALQQRLNNGLREAGFPSEEREFRAHKIGR